MSVEKPLPLPESAGCKVAILLCTKDGSPYLREQIDSIKAQTVSSWFIRVSDDGSIDNTRAILQTYQTTLGAERLSVVTGPMKGFAANFLSLTCAENIDADYFAYADQDDIWYPEKLARSLRWFKSIPDSCPALYCSRTLNVDEHNMELNLSPKFTKPPSFANALVQNIVGGNTIVFNRAAKKLMGLAGAETKVVAHDWWAYLIISGCGGIVFYDAFPTVRYRQHSYNLIGHKGNKSAWLNRARLMLQGYFRAWNATHIVALENIRAHLTPENQQCLSQFIKTRDGGLFSRLTAMKRSGIHRQTIGGNLGILAAVILKKM